MAEVDLDAVLSAEGWPYASTRSTGPGDPGRFHALFGRDALITALQVLPRRPEVARAALRAHARLQGTEERPELGEQPGKVCHEARDRAPETLVSQGWPDDGGPFRLYESADATSWYLTLLAALGEPRFTEELQAAWRGAAAWLARALTEGDGLVRYGPAGQRGGLEHQGWRDTSDPASAEGAGGGILGPGGRRPVLPLADLDVQAAAHAGLLAAARLSGDAAWGRRAARLRAAVADAFDVDTMAVEPDGTRIPGAGSQLGWALWSGLLEGERAREAATRLSERDVLTEFGLRTLSSRSDVFAPHAYHRGSIWPFDSWLGWGGLRRAGRPGTAEQVRTGVLAALERLGGAPELYAVEPDGTLAAIATSNHVQAWTIGARDALRRGWDAVPRG